MLNIMSTEMVVGFQNALIWDEVLHLNDDDDNFLMGFYEEYTVIARKYFCMMLELRH